MQINKVARQKRKKLFEQRKVHGTTKLLHGSLAQHEASLVMRRILQLDVQAEDNKQETYKNQDANSQHQKQTLSNGKEKDEIEHKNAAICDNDTSAAEDEEEDFADERKLLNNDAKDKEFSEDKEFADNEKLPENEDYLHVEEFSKNEKNRQSSSTAACLNEEAEEEDTEWQACTTLLRRKRLQIEIAHVFEETAKALQMPDAPLVLSPKSYFKTLCMVFTQEYPTLLSAQDIDAMVSKIKLPS